MYFYRCYWYTVFYDEGMLLFVIIIPPCYMPSSRKEFSIPRFISSYQIMEMLLEISNIFPP